MEVTVPVEGQSNDNNQTGQQEQPKDNVQKRIDELTAEKYAAAKAAEEAQRQVAQLTALVAQQMERQVAAPPQQEQLPEGVDPNMAKFFDSRLKSLEEEYKRRTDQMIWQMQNQIAQQTVDNQYAHVPPEVRRDAAARLTNLRMQYGEKVSMEDAMAVAHWQWLKSQGQQQRAQQYNNMGQPLPMQGAPQMPVQQAQMQSPAMRPDWDTLDYRDQNRLLDEWEKKGGRIQILP
jgi:hypothetical protein